MEQIVTKCNKKCMIIFHKFPDTPKPVVSKRILYFTSFFILFYLRIAMEIKETINRSKTIVPRCRVCNLFKSNCANLLHSARSCNFASATLNQPESQLEMELKKKSTSVSIKRKRKTTDSSLLHVFCRPIFLLYSNYLNNIQYFLMSNYQDLFLFSDILQLTFFTPDSKVKHHTLYKLLIKQWNKYSHYVFHYTLNVSKDKCKAAARKTHLR